jgi:hypothetical protein
MDEKATTGAWPENELCRWAHPTTHSNSACSYTILYSTVDPNVLNQAVSDTEIGQPIEDDPNLLKSWLVADPGMTAARITDGLVPIHVSKLHRQLTTNATPWRFDLV